MATLEGKKRPSVCNRVHEGDTGMETASLCLTCYQENSLHLQTTAPTQEGGLAWGQVP